VTLESILEDWLEVLVEADEGGIKEEDASSVSWCLLDVLTSKEELTFALRGDG
jgi:hypothetical protein